MILLQIFPILLSLPPSIQLPRPPLQAFVPFLPVSMGYIYIHICSLFNLFLPLRSVILFHISMPLVLFCTLTTKPTLTNCDGFVPCQFSYSGNTCLKILFPVWFLVRVGRRRHFVQDLESSSDVAAILSSEGQCWAPGPVATHPCNCRSAGLPSWCRAPPSLVAYKLLSDALHQLPHMLNQLNMQLHGGGHSRPSRVLKLRGERQT